MSAQEHEIYALLGKLGDEDTACLYAAAKALSDNEGMLTPSERFISQMLMVYGHKGRLLPSEVREELDEFEQDLLNMAQGARTILRCYPGVLMAQSVEAIRDVK